jgi:hypothetical protein
MLTKEFILSKFPNITDITDIKKLNLYAEDLLDISLISRMPNIEVLSLSSNQISSLSPLTNCLNVREIYLRNNNIDSFKELDHLKHLLNLKVLWLEGNPICNDIYYREKVFNILPQVIFLDNKKRIIKRERINNRKRIQSEQKQRKNEFDYDANISKSNRKKILLRRVFSYFDSANDAKSNETPNDISVKQNIKHNNFVFGNKKGDLSEFKIVFSNKGISKKQLFKKLKLKIKKEHNNNNYGFNNKINMFNNYLGNAPKISKRKLTVETNSPPMPLIIDNNTVQNSISIEGNKGIKRNNLKSITNEKYNINSNGNNNNYVMQAIYLLVDKMNVQDLLSLKCAINKKISILTKIN